MTEEITLEHVVVATADHVSADVGGELVILSLASEEYFSLNAVGMRIWSLLERPLRVREIRDRLLLDYADVEAERCTADLLALLKEMLETELIEVSPASSANVAPPNGRSAREHGRG